MRDQNNALDHIADDIERGTLEERIALLEQTVKTMKQDAAQMAFLFGQQYAETVMLTERLSAIEKGVSNG